MADIYDLTDTWNDAGVAFTSVKMDVTNTASAAGSKLLDLQVGGVSKVSVDAAGTLVSAGTVNGASPTEMGYLSGVTSGIQAQIDAAGGGAFGADANTLITPSTPIVLDQATGDEAALTLDYTTNKAAGNDTGLLINQTDTLSPGTSKLLDLQVGGASKFSVDNAGAVSIGAGIQHTAAGGGNVARTIVAGVQRLDVGATAIGISSGASIAWNSSNYSSSSGDLLLRRDAAGTLGQRNGVNAQTYNLYNTYTNATNYERGHIGWDADTFVIGTEAGSAGGVNRNLRLGVGGGQSIQFYADGSQKLSVDRDSILASKPLHFYPDNTHDIGAGGLRPRNAYLGTTLDIAQGTLTDDAQALNLTSTWNDAADTFTLIKADVTDTASAAGSKLMDLQVGGVSKLSVTSTGALHRALTGVYNAGEWLTGTDAYGVFSISPSNAAFEFAPPAANGNAQMAMTYVGNLRAVASLELGGITTADADTKLWRDAANTLGQRNGVNAQTFNLYNTYTNATDYERGHIGWNDTADTFVIGTEAGSGGGVVRDIALMGGNVGIGTTTPGSSLHVQGNIAVPYNAGGLGKLGISDPTGSTFNTYLKASAGIGYLVSEGNSVGMNLLCTNANNYISFSPGNAEKVRILPSGNVGLGTTTPATTLDVVGSIAATGTVKTTPTTVGALPAAATAGAGARTFVTDSANSLSSHHGQTVTGGGTDFVPVYSDGTTWKVG